MTIAFYTPTLSVGGYEKVVINYANVFKNNHYVIILCGKATGDLKKNIESGVQIVDFNTRMRGVFFALARWLKKNQCDILYVPFATFTSMAVIAKKISGSSVIIYSVQHGFERNSHKILQYVMRKCVNKAEVLAAVSNTVADYDSKRLNTDRGRYFVLNNPVFNSLEHVAVKCDCQVCDTLPRFVTCGRLAKDKHIEIPMRIIAELSKKRCVELIILGDGPEKENLEALIRELNVQKQIRFVGFVSNPVLYMQHCVGYFQTSEIESFGNGVIDAMRCGVPSIVTECGGPIEIIEQGRYGISIGKWDSCDVIERGVAAAESILDRTREFDSMDQKARLYDAAYLEKQFLEPYYEYIKKNKKANNTNNS